MKTEIELKESNNIINLNDDVPLPRPIPPIKCKCGCGHSFQPRRRDQKYLNKQHADYGYNHNERKKKHRNRKKFEKILRRNDRILEKHFKSERLEKCVTRYYDIIKSDGFNFAFHIGKLEKDKQSYYILYNYYYCIYMSDKSKMIKIYKR